MYWYHGKHIEIDGAGYDFEYDIRAVFQHEEQYIVLLAIPFDCDEINNIYCLDARANLVWQAEDLSVLYPTLINLPYEQMGIKDGAVFAVDFYGRSYQINIETGKIEGRRFVK